MSKLIFSAPRRFYAGRDVKRAHTSESVNAVLYMICLLVSLASSSIYFPHMTGFDGYDMMCAAGLAVSTLLGVIVNAHDLFAVMIRENRLEPHEQGGKINGHISTMCLVASCLGFNGSLLTLQMFEPRINRTGLWQRLYSSLLAFSAGALHLAQLEEFGSTQIQLRRNTAVALMTLSSAFTLLGSAFHFSSEGCSETFKFGSALYIAGSAIGCGAALANYFHVRLAQELDNAEDRKERQRKLQAKRSPTENAKVDQQNGLRGRSGWIGRLIPSFSLAGKDTGLKKTTKKIQPATKNSPAQKKTRWMDSADASSDEEPPRRSRKRR